MICLEIYRCNNTQRGHHFTIKLREKQCCSLSPVSFSASTHPRCFFFSTSSVIRLAVAARAWGLQRRQETQGPAPDPFM